MVLTRAAASENVNEVENGRDVPDAHLMVTIDSAGREFGDLSPVPIHSCINIATQTGEEHENGGSALSCFGGFVKKAVLQRLAYVGIGVLVVAFIILIERLTGRDIIDERKFIQDIVDENLPKTVRAPGGTSTPTATQPPSK